MTNRIKSAASILFSVTALATAQLGIMQFAHAAAGTEYTVPLSDDSTYKTFGEKAGLVKITDDFMSNLLADARTRPFFEKVDKTRVKTQLVEQFCQILGGPCNYGGANMAPIHKNLDIHTADFNALVEALQNAMDKNGVPFSAQNVLLGKLAPMHRDIITK